MQLMDKSDEILNREKYKSEAKIERKSYALVFLLLSLLLFVVTLSVYFVLQYLWLLIFGILFAVLSFICFIVALVKKNRRSLTALPIGMIEEEKSDIKKIEQANIEIVEIKETEDTTIKEEESEAMITKEIVTNDTLLFEDILLNLQLAFKKKDLSLSEKEALLLLAQIEQSRFLIIEGVDEKKRKDFMEAISLAFSGMEIFLKKNTDRDLLLSSYSSFLEEASKDYNRFAFLGFDGFDKEAFASFFEDQYPSYKDRYVSSRSGKNLYTSNMVFIRFVSSVEEVDSSLLSFASYLSLELLSVDTLDETKELVLLDYESVSHCLDKKIKESRPMSLTDYRKIESLYQVYQKKHPEFYLLNDKVIALEKTFALLQFSFSFEEAMDLLLEADILPWLLASLPLTSLEGTSESLLSVFERNYDRYPMSRANKAIHSAIEKEKQL